MTPFQIRLVLALCLFGVPWSVWEIFEGFNKGRILVPFNKWNQYVLIGDHISFALCVLGWIIALALFALGATAMSLLVRRRPSR
jgi:hypothetical protein